MQPSSWPRSGQKYLLGSPQVQRGRLILEVAAELSAVANWPHHQPLVYMRAQGAQEWGVCLFGSDSWEVVNQVASREVTFAIVNPGAILALAIRGLGPYSEPVPVRAITVLPQIDQLGFAVRADTGLVSLTDLRDRRYPLRVSVRGQRNHSGLVLIRETVAALGFTLEDIDSWGGHVSYDQGTPDLRIAAFERGEIDAIWDEAMPMYAETALSLGMRFLRFDEEHLVKLEAMGLRRVRLDKETYPTIEEEIWAIDFSGWIVYTHADTPDDLVTAFCDALEVRKDRIPFTARDGVAGRKELPLDWMCRDTKEGPLYVPLHPAAERFWRQKGYIE
ncbi:MAG: hypothetical protein HW416_2083 [Chloroflexi bacterium]|nr:hypothetical protein [Chloroflexota bacterium]